MTRLQKKCLAGSVCFHGLTVAVLLATAAFRSEPSITEAQVLNLVIFPPQSWIVPVSGGELAPAAVIPQPAPPATHPAPPRACGNPAPAPPIRPNRPRPQCQDRHPSRRPSKPAPVKPATDRPRQDAVDLPRQFPPPPNRRPETAHSSAQAQAAAQEARQEAPAGNRRRFSPLWVPASRAKPPGQAWRLSPEKAAAKRSSITDTAVFNAYYQAWKPGRDDPQTGRGGCQNRGFAQRQHYFLRIRQQVRAIRRWTTPSSARWMRSNARNCPHSRPTRTDTERSFIIRFNLEAKQSAG